MPQVKSETFVLVLSTKNYSNSAQSGSKKKKTLIKLTFDNTESYNQPFILSELQNSLSKSNNSASSSDEIHYTLLKELSTISLKYLLDIYYNIWISGNIPTLWKQATTIPILKKTKKIPQTLLVIDL